MEIVIRIDVLQEKLRKMKETLTVLFDAAFQAGVAGAGILSFFYICYRVFTMFVVL